MPTENLARAKLLVNWYCHPSCFPTRLLLPHVFAATSCLCILLSASRLLSSTSQATLGQGPPAGCRAQVGPTRAWPSKQPSHGPSVPHRVPLISSPLNMLSPCSRALSQLAAFSWFTRNQMQRADWAIHTGKKGQSGECPQCPLTWYWTQYWHRLGMFMLSPNSNMPQVPAEGSWRLPRRSCGEEDQDFAAHTTEASSNQEAGRF